MTSHDKTLFVPYTPEEMFSLVADVERYPEFVPGYREARVVRREGDSLYTVQRIGLGITWRFHSVATLAPPGRIRIRSTEGPFDALDIEWNFEAVPGGCRVAFRARAHLDGGLPSRLLQPWLDRLADVVPAAFAARAGALYGQREGPGPT